VSVHPVKNDTRNLAMTKITLKDMTNENYWTTDPFPNAIKKENCEVWEYCKLGIRWETPRLQIISTKQSNKQSGMMKHTNKQVNTWET
jgi:hypothetical protein